MGGEREIMFDEFVKIEDIICRISKSEQSGGVLDFQKPSLRCHTKLECTVLMVIYCVRLED